MDPRPPRRPTVVAACKPPVTPGARGWKAAAGGLTPIVRATLERRGGTWVSWDGGTTTPPSQLPGLGFDLSTFRLDRGTAAGFYGGYANRMLWPLFHELTPPPMPTRSWWGAYREVNDTFARHVAIAAAEKAEAVIWLHDYHLMLTPLALRDLGVATPTAFFLHTPFPSPSTFARIPQRHEILDGLAGADLVAFQTTGDCERFRQTWADLGGRYPPSLTTAAASVDVDAVTDRAVDPAVVRAATTLRRRWGDRVVVFGAERLDYTKGIPHRLKAIEALLERRRDLRRRLLYVQVAAPSRERVPEYVSLQEQVEQEVGRINGRFTAPGYDVPIRYLRCQLSALQMTAYYLAVDVALVSPLRDGMNLVAKEFVTARSAGDGRGVLVLSEFAGAADELVDAITCNPFDIDGTSHALERAIDMDDDERRKRLASCARQVAAHDVHRWADLQLRAL